MNKGDIGLIIGLAIASILTGIAVAESLLWFFEHVRIV
jgi:hypothetical protein